MKKVDKELLVFGARFNTDGHFYKSFPVSDFEILNFEKKYGLELPEDFRHFLSEIGFGSGPFYGIWSLKEIDEELSIEMEDFFETSKIIISPSNDFPFGFRDLELIKSNNHPKNYLNLGLRATYPIDGAIPIVHHGCQYYSAIITAGELIGTVWDFYLEGDFEAYWSPAFTPGILTVRSGKIGTDSFKSETFPKSESLIYCPQPVNFINWYEIWLDNSLLALRQANKSNLIEIIKQFFPF